MFLLRANRLTGIPPFLNLFKVSLRGSICLERTNVHNLFYNELLIKKTRSFANVYKISFNSRYCTTKTYK